MAFIVAVNQMEYAVSFRRDRDRTYRCTIKAGAYGTPPSEMEVISTGWSKRYRPNATERSYGNKPDQFDKGIGQSVSLLKALNNATHAGRLHPAIVSKIEDAHLFWMQEKGVKTSLV